MFHVQLARMLINASHRASRGASAAMERGLERHCRERVRPDLTVPIESRERVYRGERRCDLAAGDVAYHFAEFAEDYLSEWRRTAAFVSERGVATSEYTGRVSPMVHLIPRSWSAGQVAMASRGRPGSGCIEARVPFRYQARFELQPLPKGEGTLLRYRTIELADPELSCGYDLVRHFEVPAMPMGFGRVGERFLACCAR